MAITNGLKISQLPDAFDFKPSDYVPISRGSITRKVSGQILIDRFTENDSYQIGIVSTGNKVINIVHNLNSTFVNVFVYEKIGTTYEIVYPTVTLVTANTITLTFKTPPPNNKYTVLVTK
jgi:hypothetical protein